MSVFGKISQHTEELEKLIVLCSESSSPVFSGPQIAETKDSGCFWVFMVSPSCLMRLSFTFPEALGQTLTMK